jgi:hypothetical protein
MVDVGRVDGGDDVAVVLELVEVAFGARDGVVEGVYERRIVRAEGQLVDVVREIKACLPSVNAPAWECDLRLWSRCSANSSM